MSFDSTPLHPVHMTSSHSVSPINRNVYQSVTGSRVAINGMRSAGCGESISKPLRWDKILILIITRIRFDWKCAVKRNVTLKRFLTVLTTWHGIWNEKYWNRGKLLQTPFHAAFPLSFPCFNANNHLHETRNLLAFKIRCFVFCGRTNWTFCRFSCSLCSRRWERFVCDDFC